MKSAKAFRAKPSIEDTREESLLRRQKLVTLRQEWILEHQPTNDGRDENGRDAGKENTTATAGDYEATTRKSPALSLKPLQQWMSTEGQRFDKKEISSLIQLLHEEALPVATKSKLQTEMPEQESSNSHPPEPGNTSATELTHKLEWMVLVLLELRLARGALVVEKIVAKHWTKHQLKKVKKKRRKEKDTNKKLTPDSASSLFLEYLVHILSQAAFVLSGDEAFGLFLTRRCLTSDMWKRLPKLVSSVFEAFEIPNPYCAPPPEPDFPKKRITAKKKQQKRKLALASRPTTNSNAPLPPKRRLPPKRGNFRHNHFHGKLGDMAKLLQASSTTPNTRPGTTATILKQSKVANTNNRSSKSIITPHAGPRPSNLAGEKKANKPDSRSIGQENHKRPVRSLQSHTQHSPAQKRSHNTIAIAETPMPSRKKQHRDETPPSRSDLIAETPYTCRASRHPITTIGVAETPMTGGRGGAPHIADRSWCDGSTPSHALFLSPPATSKKAAVVQPLKLFGMLKKSTNTQKPESPVQDEEIMPSARAAVESARAYLRRRSL